VFLYISPHLLYQPDHTSHWSLMLPFSCLLLTLHFGKYGPFQSQP
jgi:hypothetical protein